MIAASVFWILVYLYPLISITPLYTRLARRVGDKAWALLLRANDCKGRCRA